MDLSVTHEMMRAELVSSFSRVLDRGDFLLGDELARFERAWADYCDTKHAIGVGNGLDALHLILRALDIGPGDEVVVPANTFIATWLAVSMCGATPVPVEPDPRTMNIDVTKAAGAITPKTKAIIAVHLYGSPADLDGLLAVARAANVHLLEDAAQAHGARYRGGRIGGHTAAAAWSFYPGKNLGALGDAGAITTNDGALAEKVRLLRNYGSRVKYNHELQGVNSRLDEVQAAILNEKLAYLDTWNERRRVIAGRYLKVLRPFLARDPERPTNELFSIPEIPSANESVWHLFVIRVASRGALVAFLNERGIQTSVHYPRPPADQPAFALARNDSNDSTSFSSYSADQLISLPIGPHLSEEQIETVETALTDFFSSTQP